MPNVVKFPNNSSNKLSKMDIILANVTVIGEDGFSDWRLVGDTASYDEPTLAMAA